MAYTQAELHTKIRTLLNEASEGFFLNTEIDGWIIEGVYDISIKARCVEAETPIEFPPNILSVSEPDRVVAVEAVFLNDRPLVKAHVRQFGHTQVETADAPSLFTHFARKVYAYPITPVHASGFVLYAKWTQTLADLPDAYHHLIVPYAACQGKIKDQRYAEANALYAAYISALNFQRLSLQQQVPDSQEQLEIPDRVETVNG